MVTVIFGVDQDTADLAGKTVGEARTIYNNIFNLPPDAIAKVNGRQVKDDYILQDNEKLEFEKVTIKAA